MEAIHARVEAMGPEVEGWKPLDDAAKKRMRSPEELDKLNTLVISSRLKLRRVMAEIFGEDDLNERNFPTEEEIKNNFRMPLKLAVFFLAREALAVFFLAREKYTYSGRRADFVLRRKLCIMKH